MVIKIFELDIRGLNTALAHEELLEFLQKKDLFNEDFLYRGTGIDEISWLEGKAKRQFLELFFGYFLDEKPDESSISFYTQNDIVSIINGTSETDSPIKIAQSRVDQIFTEQRKTPIIAVYKDNHFIRKNNTSSEFYYIFRDLKKRLRALESYIMLKD